MEENCYDSLEDVKTGQRTSSRRKLPVPPLNGLTSHFQSDKASENDTLGTESKMFVQMKIFITVLDI